MFKEKCYPFTREGLELAFQHRNYIENVKETLIEYPELFPLALLGVLGLSTILINPMASMVAYKSSIDIPMVAFKYLGGF